MLDPMTKPLGSRQPVEDCTQEISFEYSTECFRTISIILSAPNNIIRASQTFSPPSNEFPPTKLSETSFEEILQSGSQKYSQKLRRNPVDGRRAAAEEELRNAIFAVVGCLTNMFGIFVSSDI